MDSLYFYRLPGDSDFIGRLGVEAVGINRGFVISSFYNLPEATSTIIPQKDLHFSDLNKTHKNILCALKHRDDVNDLFPFPECSTSKGSYLKSVAEIISGLNSEEKTVYSRVIAGEEEIDLEVTLSRLSVRFPNALIFCFHTPHAGTWIGATPEKLLQNKNGILSTVALAGTRSKDISTPETAWDSKNLVEQKMVADYIERLFKQFEIPVKYDSEPQTKVVGSLEHLCTEFKTITPKLIPTSQLSDFLYQLSPTPALCGFPKQRSYEIIKKNENFSRAYYGGFCGPYFSEDSFTFYVILRSIRISSTGWCMYAGGGITADSQPETEWEETCRKASSILDCVTFSDKV